MVAGLALSRWRLAGPLLVGAYTLVTLATFTWLYPILTGETISLHAWNLRIPFPGWI
jgi:dolichyl-phosphate-mannose--protein O-mannosyl transferase